MNSSESKDQHNPGNSGLSPASHFTTQQVAHSVSGPNASIPSEDIQGHSQRQSIAPELLERFVQLKDIESLGIEERIAKFTAMLNELQRELDKTKS